MSTLVVRIALMARRPRSLPEKLVGNMGGAVQTDSKGKTFASFQAF
jgi:hypothetical protein